MKEGKGLSALFRNLQKSIDINGGIDAANEAILKTHKEKTVHEQIFDTIMKEVLFEWESLGKLKRNDILRKHVRGEAAQARDILIVLIYSNTTLTTYEISSLLKTTSIRTIQLAIYNFKKLDPDNRVDKKIIEKHDRILVRIQKSKNGGLKK